MNRLPMHVVVVCGALVQFGCAQSSGGGGGGAGGTAGFGGSAGVAAALDCTGGQGEVAWASFGQDLCNSRAQSETTISSDNASDLELKWVFDGFTEDDVEHRVGDISATPSVVGDSVYFVDWTEGDEEAKVYRVHKETAEVVWWRYIWDIADFVEVGSGGERTPIPGLVSRTTPLVVGDSVVIGTQRRRPELYQDPRPNAWIISLNKDTGAVQWKTEPPRDPLWPTPAQDPNPQDEMGGDLLPIPDGSEVVITASPVAYDNRIYVGVSGWAEFLSFWAHFRFFFRGSVLCLDADNGDVIWQSFMVDDDLYVTTEEPETDPDTDQPIPRDRRRYSGNSVWSSAPAIDVARGRLYVTTGNNHTAPQSVLEDVGSGALTDLPQPGNYMDSIVALDLASGAVEWSYSPVGSLVDVWQIFCRDTDSEACAEGPDFDYGAGANLFSVEIDGARRHVVGAGSKAGMYSAIDADAATLRPTPLWETQVGPGSHFGGIHWGTSVENGVVYVPLGDGFRESGENGFFAAIDGATGDFNWRVPNPIADVGSPPANYSPAFGGVDMSIHAPTTVANGVVFAAPFDLDGHMLALDAATGDLLWSYPSGATVYGGAAVVDGVVYWGNGYQTIAGTRGTGLFAFHVPGGAPKCVLQTEAAPSGLLQLDVETVAEGLEVPWGLAFLPDGNVLVTERPGRLLLLRTGETPALVEEVDVAQVDAQFGFEGGLLGILLHPDFETNRLFYLYYTATKPDDSLVNRIERYELANDALSATPDQIILDDIPAGDYHQGGRMRIGPDGLLYVGVGAFEASLSQDPDSLAGKLLRMHLDGSIPADNPNPSSLVFISGIRNTQGFDWFDENRLLIMDHGPTQQTDGVRGLDELNVARAGDNLGWPDIWGCEVSDGLMPPAMVWEEPLPPGGATIYTGTAIPSWTGSLMAAALGFSTPSGQHLHRLELDPADPRTVVAQESFLVGTYGRLRTAAMGPDGHLYLTTSNCDGIRSSCPEEGDLVLRIVGAIGAPLSTYP